MLLSVNNVHKSFGSLEVLKGVDLSVNRGDVVAVLGPSGSGKTTLLRCMNFLERADEGTLTFNGEQFPLAREKGEHSSIVDGIASLYNHSENQSGSSSENWT